MTNLCPLHMIIAQSILRRVKKRYRHDWLEKKKKKKKVFNSQLGGILDIDEYGIHKG